MRTIGVLAVLFVALVGLAAIPAAQAKHFSCGDYDYRNAVECVPALDGFATMFDNFTNHVAVVTRTQREYDYQLASYSNAGIGPWLPLVQFRNISAIYCGEFMNKTFSVDILLTTSRTVGASPSFWEIFTIVGDVPNYFSDWYDQHGPSIPYHGLQVKKDAAGQAIVTPREFAAWLEERNIETIFRFGFDAPGGKNAFFIRIGYVLAEVVFVNPNPIPVDWN